jgi:glycine oxidase
MKILIAGGGIAGTTLAHLCAPKGIDFRVVDKGVNHSSAVAAGIINPLVFRRMTLSWRAGELIPFAEQFYRSVETKLGSTFLHPVVIRRLFSSEQEAGYWMKKQHLPVYSAFMTEQTEADRQFPSPLNTFGTGLVKGAFYVEAATYYQAQLSWLNQQGKLDTEVLDYARIDPEKGTYKGEQFDHIVFCEGKDGKTNPWFGYLPLQQTKGELLTIHAPTISQNESLNRKCFMLPVGNGQFRVGSTYVWDTDNNVVTEEGRHAIEQNLASVTTEPYEIVEQVAGVRPTVTDRRPLIGTHPEFPKLVVANGLGTKGYMLAPKIMDELIAHLREGTPIHPEADISRFVK